MTDPETLETVTKAYEIEVSVVECVNGQRGKVIRREMLGRFPSEAEAQKIFELVELPDLNHIIII